MIWQRVLDVVILHIVMPEVDGFGVLANIDYSKMLKRPNFIMVSQLTGDNFINKAISLGASYYLVKPINSFNVATCRKM